MKPQLLISGHNGSCANYENAIRHAGGEPHAAYCPEVDLSYDGLVLGGGDDMDPSFFGQENQGSCLIDLKRDRAELALVRRFAEAKKPILGICRGHQVVQIALGGTLHQDIGALCVFHQAEDDQDRFHLIRIAPSSLLAQLYHKPSILVNSTHHQSVDRLGTGMYATAWAESDLIEASEHETLPIFTLQFHPERMLREDAELNLVNCDGIFSHFVKLCRRD
ncbi:MAG: gamma-glutamyl-gamma-aminobutyrate hydrolase family protein [Evtepia sp.]